MNARGGDSDGLLCGPLLFSTHPTLTNTFYVTYFKREFQDGSCRLEKHPTASRKNSQLSFLPLELDEGEYSVQFSFQPSWYAVTEGQPVPTDCLQINRDGLTFTAGLSMSTGVQKAFTEHQTGDTVLHENSYRRDHTLPKKLYFTLEGTVTFQFNRSGELFASSHVMRFGRGHSFWSGPPPDLDNWWLGNEACRHEQACSKCSESLRDRVGLVCGELFFIYPQPQSRELPFYVVPLAWVQ